jgi:hypothetical protein
MTSDPTEPLETLHATWCRAFEASLASEITAAAFPVGYEHAYAAAAGERLLLVCPWHWRQYSHYQFWELAGAAFLARQAGFRDWALVTNDAWTPWILPALRVLYGSVIAGDLPAVVERAREWLTAEASPPSLPADRPVGCIDLGDVDRATTTVRLKERVGQTASDLLWRYGRRSMPWGRR